MSNSKNLVSSNDSILSVSATMVLTDVWGHPIIRQAHLGRAEGVSLRDARKMVEKARKNNPQHSLKAVFKVSL